MIQTLPLRLVDMAENESGVSIHFDKLLLGLEETQRILNMLRRFKEYVQTMEFDEDGVPYVGDEEQAEIEAILDSMTDEDKEIVWRERFEI